MSQEVFSIDFQNGTKLNIPALTPNSAYELKSEFQNNVFFIFDTKGNIFAINDYDLDGHHWYYDETNRRYYYPNPTEVHTYVSIPEQTTGTTTRIFMFGFVYYNNISDNYCFQIYDSRDFGDARTNFFINGISYTGASFSAFVMAQEKKSDETKKQYALNVSNKNPMPGNSQFYYKTSFLGGYTITNDSMKNKFTISANTTNPNDNPNPGEYPSGTGGGKGNYDNTSDSVGIPTLPVISAVNTGMCTMFNPTLAELQALGSWLWKDDAITAIKKTFETNPLEGIIGLSLTPVSPGSLSSKNVVIGTADSGVSMPVCSSQYAQFDCGFLTLSEYWGTALDYSPFTRAQLYLPYIGMENVDIDDVMSSENHLVYNIDCLTGACVAFLHCTKGELSSVLYSWSGNVNTNIPITGQNWSELVKSILQTTATAATAIGTTVATGGAAAPAAGAMVGGAIGSAVNTLNSAKPQVQRGGGMSSSMGALAVQTPYFILSRPAQSLPESYNHCMGYPANFSSSLSSLSGYTEMEQVFVSVATATDSEKKEIESLLKGGIIL
jgi:hypothetical protein